jgi:hypothetical protein
VVTDLDGDGRADVVATLQSGNLPPHLLVARQREDGSFPHSRADYRILSDRRSYPRNLAMILVHLLAADRSAAR